MFGTNINIATITIAWTNKCMVSIVFVGGWAPAEGPGGEPPAEGPPPPPSGSGGDARRGAWGGGEAPKDFTTPQQTIH